MLSRSWSLLATALAGALSAQQAFPVPPDLLSGFHLRDGTAQELVLPPGDASPFTVRLVLGGTERTLSLAPHDVRASDFRLLVDDGTRLTQVPTPVNVTYRGTVIGLPGSEVAATLVGGELSAAIVLDDGTLWAVQPARAVNPTLPRTAHVVYRGADVVHPEGTCGATGRPVPVGVSGPAPAALKIAEIAIDADRAYYARYGSNTTTVQNQVTSVINAMSVIYRRDVEIDYTITTIIVRTTNIYSWNGDLCNLLSQFGNYWSGNHGGVRRDLAHLFTGEGSFSGVIGCAYLGVVCTGSGYGASKAFSSNLVTNTGLVSHEVGHNWNAPHCDSSSPCNIMCSGLGGCSRNLTSFAPVTISRIIAFKNTRGCLSDASPPVLGFLNPGSVPAFEPPQVVATGTRLDSVTSVTVGGRNVSFTRVDPITLRFTPPSPGPIGPQAVVVTNGSGSSNPVNLNVTGNHPSVLVSTQVLLRNFPNRVELHSDANWLGLLLISTSNAPSVLPGVVNLGIGNAFTELLEVGTVTCGADGAAIIPLNLPLSVPSGLPLFLQAITVDPMNFRAPLETSNVRSGTTL